MKIQSLFLTTDIKSREESATKAFHSLHNNGGRCCDKIVLAQDLCENPDPNLVGSSYHKGWFTNSTIVKGNCTGHRAMANNMLRGLEYMDDEALMIYCEDHVFITELPSRAWFEDFFDSVRIGWLCLNTHVHEENLCGVPGFVEKPGREEKLAYIQNPGNWRRCRKYDVLMKRHPIVDEYLLNFPAAITKVGHFRKLLEHGMKNYHDVGIEVGFTMAWQELFPDVGVGILANKSNLKGKSIQSFQDLHDCALMKFRNNNPSMKHDSVVDHKDLPKNDNDKRAFF